MAQCTRLFLATLVISLLPACGAETGSPPEREGAASDAVTGAIDGCAVVTQDDATALFGKPAVRQEGQGFRPPMMLAECMWTWDTETANQLLQFRVWDTEQGYSRPEDEYTQTFAIGDRGHVRVHPLAGVDVEWTQGNRTIGLSYSKVGAEVPEAATKTDAVKALALSAAAKL